MFSAEENEFSGKTQKDLLLEFDFIQAGKYKDPQSIQENLIYPLFFDLKKTKDVQALKAGLMKSAEKVFPGFPDYDEAVKEIKNNLRRIFKVIDKSIEPQLQLFNDLWDLAIEASKMETMVVTNWISIRSAQAARDLIFMLREFTRVLLERTDELFQLKSDKNKSDEVKAQQKLHILSS